MQTITWQWAALVAAGGAAGALARGTAAVLWVARFPWATLWVNVLGSLLIGWVAAKFPETAGAGASAGDVRCWRTLLATGFCGGFTTFSAFSLQTFEQFEKGQPALALANIVLSLALCLGGVWLGWKLGRW
ncbi:MAG: CrcB family protein [Puniceicoccales bacterium]|jgi:CrcB protein|nr:CrcB family protein [Puniceicoccales bacterium]